MCLDLSQPTNWLTNRACPQEAYHYTVPFVVFGAMMASVGFAGLLFPETLQRPLPNILPCRHRTIPLHEGVRLVTNPWDALWPSASPLDTLVSSQSPLHQLRHLFPSSSLCPWPTHGSLCAGSCTVMTSGGFECWMLLTRPASGSWRVWQGE